MDSLIGGGGGGRGLRRRYGSDDSTSVSEGTLDPDVLRPLGLPVDKSRFPLSPRSEQAYDAISCEFDALFEQLCQSPPFGLDSLGFGFPANGGGAPAGAAGGAGRGRPGRRKRGLPDPLAGLGYEPAAKAFKAEPGTAPRPQHPLSLSSGGALSTPIEPIAPGSGPGPGSGELGSGPPPAGLPGAAALMSGATTPLQNSQVLSELLLAAAVHANRTDGRGGKQAAPSPAPAAAPEAAGEPAAAQAGPSGRGDHPHAAAEVAAPQPSAPHPQPHPPGTAGAASEPGSSAAAAASAAQQAAPPGAGLDAQRAGSGGVSLGGAQAEGSKAESGDGPPPVAAATT